MSEYLWAKVVLFGIAAIIWGFYCGKNGLELNGRPKGQAPREPVQDVKAPPAALPPDTH
jgi:hypothetical protein